MNSKLTTLIHKQQRRCTYNVTLRRVRAIRITLHWGVFVQSFLRWKCNEYYIIWVCVCSFRYPACSAHVPFCHLYPVPLFHIFPHYLINGTILGKNVLNTTFFLYSLQLFVWNISHSKKNWARYDKNAYWSSCKVIFTLVRFALCQQIFRKLLKCKISLKIRALGAELFHADGWTERRDGGNSRFSKSCKSAKWTVLIKLLYAVFSVLL
jgi:hypothetical protein